MTSTAKIEVQVREQDGNLELQRAGDIQAALKLGAHDRRAAKEHLDLQSLAKLPMRLTAGVPLAKFRVKDLVALKEGQTLLTISSSTSDVPLSIGSVQLGWSEFEVVEQRIALRLTRLV